MIKPSHLCSFWLRPREGNRLDSCSNASVKPRFFQRLTQRVREFRWLRHLVFVSSLRRFRTHPAGAHSGRTSSGAPPGPLLALHLDQPPEGVLPPYARGCRQRKIQSMQMCPPETSANPRLRSYFSPRRDPTPRTSSKILDLVVIFGYFL